MPDKPLRPACPEQRGRVETPTIESAVLRGNPLGDPAARELPVYLPAGYGQDGKRYPVLWCLAAYTNAGPGQVAWRNHGENLPERLDRLIYNGKMPPVIAVFPDCYTAFGGNQYVNSSAVGRYADYLVDELVPAVDRRFHTVPEAGARAVFGKSSGGFGALHLSMTRPGVWSAAASHAGDCGFDRVYLRDFPACCDVLARYDGDIGAFIRAFWRARRPRGDQFHAMLTLGLAASYSPDPQAPGGFRLPFDLNTCTLDEYVWRRWLEFDPVAAAVKHADALKSLSGLWLDVGKRDQYYIHYGCRELHQVLKELGVNHVYEEFDGTHSGIDWRLDHSLPWLVSHLVDTT